MEGTSSLWATIINIVKTILGAGMLGLPYAYGQTGQLLGIFLLVLMALAQAFALHLLSLCITEAHARGERYPSYRSLANDAFGGNAVANKLVEACVGLGCFGFGTSYLVVIGGLCPDIISYCGVTNQVLIARWFWVALLGCGVGLPLFCLKKLDSLKVSSLIGNIGCVFIVIVCCIFAAGGLKAPNPEQPATFLMPAQTNYTSIAGMLEVLSIYVFAFSCSQNMPGFANELKNATMRRIDLSIAIGITICICMYVLAALCGSVVFGASVDPNLLVSFPQQHGTVEGAVATIARVAVVLNVCGSFPLFMHPTRASISQIFFQKSPNELPFFAWAALTGVIFGTSLIIGLSVKSLDTMLGFAGGTTGMLIGFAFPGIFYYQLHRKSGMREGALEMATLSLQNCDPEPRSVHGKGMTMAALILGVVGILLIPVLFVVQIVKMTS